MFFLEGFTMDVGDFDVILLGAEVKINKLKGSQETGGYPE